MGILDGQVAVVTGAATGIGEAIAARLAAEGARVAMLDLDRSALEAAALRIGEHAYPVQADIRDQVSVDIAVEKAAEIGLINILVNNAAARTRKTTILHLTLAEWREAIDVNLTGAFMVTAAVLPAMVARRSGIIINVASQLGSVAVADSAAYCATKGGLIQFTKALALDHADDGIRVNSLSPGAVITGRITRVYGGEAEADAALGPKHALGRLGRVHEIAEAALFLANPTNSFMTGADLVVDGGYTAQ